jgi:Tfp pilus assembly protein PilO
MRIKDLIQPQKKIVLVVLTAIAVFFILWLFAYFSLRAKIKAASALLEGAEKQIQETESLVADAKSIDEGLLALRQRLQELNSKFPQKEEESLKILSDLARENNIEVRTLRPQSKTQAIQGQEGIGADGKALWRVLISLEMSASYKDLVAYLDSLKESLNAYFTIEKLEMRKAEGGGKLGINMDINLYLLS